MSSKAALPETTRAFIHDDFLLTTQSARDLYHQFAASQPILDYHCHLSARDIAEDRRFNNLYEIWLEGDHYKWRAMRANGIAEEYCTGNADPYHKYMAWARTVPYTIGNPLYQWTHLELKRYFGIDELLNEHTAPAIWEQANALLTSAELSAHGILEKFHVKAVCTTDDPTEDLSRHRQIAKLHEKFRVFPAFRPDKSLGVHDIDAFNAWTGRLEKASGTEIRDFDSFLAGLRRRHDDFHALGGRLSDHGLYRCYANFCSKTVAAEIFDKARSGRVVATEEHEQFASYMMLFFGHLDAEKGWAKQLHLGAFRNANTRALQQLGPDTGFDSIGDRRQIERLGAYLDRLSQDDALPKTIIYNLNPADNYALAAMCGNFQDGSVPAKIQFGSGWWFLDQKQGIEWQLQALANTGLLSRFVGMVTDSRSFMSFPRHEYFRRVLCNWLGGLMENGELPDDHDLIGSMVANICFHNAATYLELEL
ncbi:MAG TPA: glucuronate isomerase [Terriglobales bacterium]|nr:glucuronate isomerase [Terriglobales bacterium]